MADRKVIWSPQPKQAAFMARPEYEVLYGGAAGGGKSDALMVEALRQAHIPHYRGILFRRTYPQLEALIARSKQIYPKVFPGARYHKAEKVWEFPSGAVIFFGYMQYEDDKFNFQGKPFDFEGFDELTHFSEGQYTYLMSRNRPNGDDTRVYLRASANPGGVGALWVCARFVDAAPPMTPIEEAYEIEAPDGRIIRQKKQRLFVPATVFDNQILLSRDPMYLATLKSLPEAESRALLYGDWHSFEGQVFREWRDDPAHYRDRLFTHVIEPFDPPRHWTCWRGFDFGYAKPFSVGWFVADEDGKVYRIREFYGCTGKPNEGVMMNAADIAKNIREIEKSDPMLRGREIVGVADPSIFDESRGQSIAAIMACHPNYVYWRPGDNARLAGIQQFHYRLAFDANGACMFQVFHTCRAFIRTFRQLVYDRRKVEDINTEMEDHAYDECRYVLMERPISQRLPARAEAPALDPLDRNIHVFRR